MSNPSGAEIVVLQGAQADFARPLSAVEIQAGVNLIQQVMRAVMKEGVHYGKIPGTPKPTLYKPGAEKLLSTFRIATEPRVIDDLSGPDEIRYRVTVAATAVSTGAFLSSATGECSSSEEKYKWRKPVCDDEFNETHEDRRRTVWKKGERGPYQLKQVRTAPSDVANTILKMAHKRGLVAVTLVVTAASDIFAQDIEDLPEEIRADVAHDEDGEKPHLREPQPEPAAPAAAPITPGVRVKNVKVAKTGKNANGDWKLFVVELSDGQEYTTFSESLAGAAKKLKDSGVTVTFEFEQTEKGKNLILIEEIR